MAAFMRRSLNVFKQPSCVYSCMIRAISGSNSFGFGLRSTAVDSSPLYTPRKRDKDNLLNLIHRKLDLNIGVSNDLFWQLFEYCEKNDDWTEIDANLLLFICSVGPFDSPLQKRLEMAEEIWNKIQQLGLPVTTRLYNLRLKVLLSNKTILNPIEELVKMKYLGLNPDKVTYTCLIEAFCQQGNTTAANNVLDTMDKAEYMIGVPIFNSFITGHLAAGSLEEAENVLTIMQTRGLEPTTDTFLRFALHFAEKGDIDAVLKYMSDAESQGLPFQNSELLQLYTVMVRSGHSNQTEQLLNVISAKGIYRGLTMQTSCQLVSEGLNDAAFNLFRVMPILEDVKVHSNAGSFLIKAMILNGQSAPAVLSVADQICEYNVKALPHRHALLTAYKANRADAAVQLLELMKAKNHDIKVPHILPAIVHYKKEQNKEGLYRVLNMLLEIPNNIDDKLDALLLFGYPALEALNQSREEIVSNLKEHEKALNFLFLLKDLEKSCAVALKNVSDKQIDDDFCLWDGLEEHFLKTFPAELDSLVELLDYLSHQSRSRGRLEGVRNYILSYPAFDDKWQVVDQLLTGFIDKKMTLGSSIKNFRWYKNAPESIKEKIELILHKTDRSASREMPFVSFEDMDLMTVEELEKLGKQRPNLRIVAIPLLDKALDTNNLETIKSRLAEFYNAGFKLQYKTFPKVIYKLLDLGDLSSAKQHFNTLISAGSNFQAMIPLRIAENQVQAGQLQDALEMIQHADNSTLPRDSSTRKRIAYSLRRIILNAPSGPAAQQLHSEIVQSKTLSSEEAPPFIHSAYIAKLLTEEDDCSLLEALSYLTNTYNVFPHLDMVLVRFIQKQDVGNLKKVMDMGVSTFGSDDFNVRLALAFIDCKMASRARAVFMTPGLKVHEKPLRIGCQNFVRNKHIESLESLAAISQDLQISRALVMQFLLEGYVAVDNLKKVTQVLEEMSASPISLPASTINLLVQAYSTHNLAVPESLQALGSRTQAAQTSSSSSDSDSSQSDAEVPEPKNEAKIKTNPPGQN